MQLRALFGGTFDPIHRGHIETALALLDELAITTLHVMPNAIPPHKPQPSASGEQRLKMVELACRPYHALVPEDFELTSPQPSYTVKTLQRFKQLYPADTLLFVMGMDSLVSLDSWYQWQTLIQLAHLIVMPRPGYKLAQASEPLQQFIRQHQCASVSQLKQFSQGGIYLAKTPLVNVSATAIREQLYQHHSSDALTSAVADYIRQQQLYR